MKYGAQLTGTVLVVSAFLQGGVAEAAENWWPTKIYDLDSGSVKIIEYSPLPKADKPWKICVLFPHMKDTFWVAIDYGIVDEARREGVNVTVYQAGGYENLPRQVSQFDDCLAGNFDAIVIGAISEAGVAKEIAKGMASGKPVIAVANPVANAPVTSKITNDSDVQGMMGGNYLVEYLNGKQANVMIFPGPAGSGWAEDYVKGFKQAVNGKSNVKVLDDKFGDSGVAVQLGLIQNALQAYPDLNVIWGCAPAAEAALGAVAQAGRKGILIMASYENQAMMDALGKGEILGFGTSYPVLSGRFALDTAVRALEKKEYVKSAKTISNVVAKSNIDRINMSLVLAPADFKGVYQVNAK
jgi:periplasmic protein TorT